MNLSFLSGPAFWLGALALAGALYALQRLRVRHREVTVVTTLFWRDALEETRARTLVERFRHPLAYALVLAIALLAWLSVAGPRADRDDGADHLFLLDLSEPMAAAGRFEEAVAALAAEVRRADRAHRRVVACGARVETLLAPGEDELLLPERLAAVAPEACAPSVERALLALVSGPRERPLVCTVVGVAAVRAELLELLPDGVRVERVALADAAPEPAIVDAVFGPAAAPDAAPDAVDLWVRVRGAGARLALEDGGRERRSDRVEPLGGGEERAVFSGLSADGREVVLVLEGAPEAALTARLPLVVPDRRPVRVALSPSVPDALRLALSENPGVVLDAADPEVAVRLAGEELGGDVPALELSSADDGEAAFVLVHGELADPRSLLFAALGDLGLEWVDAGGLAQASGREIALAERVGPRRGLVLWRELVAEGAPFASDAAFPLVVARSVEWLAGREAPRFASRAGERVPGARSDLRVALGGEELVLPGLGEEPVPTRVGRAVELTADGSAAGVLAATPAAAPRDDALVARAAAAPPATAFDLANLVLVGLLGLLVVEWALVRRGRMP